MSKLTSVTVCAMILSFVSLCAPSHVVAASGTRSFVRVRDDDSNQDLKFRAVGYGASQSSSTRSIVRRGPKRATYDEAKQDIDQECKSEHGC
jgi:hypothetical protein